MFDSLSDRFEAIFTRMRGRGRLGEKEIDEIAREIRLALLEADVNFKVVKSFIGRVKEQAAGADLSKSLSPAQQVIKIVHEELINTLGGDDRQADDEPEAADRGHAGRPAGLREDDRLRQAGPPPQEPGPPAAAGGGRPPAPGRRDPAPGARRAGRRARLQRADRPGHAWPATPATRPARLGKNVDRPRHRRPPPDRRRADGRAAPHAGGRCSPTTSCSWSTP